jgi:glutathione S-transferase
MTNPTITLYHNEISTCAQKVRLALAEKSLDFESVLLDLSAGDQHRPEYRALNRDGVVPTLTRGDDVIVESSVINEYLEDAYPETALRPRELAAAARVRLWEKRIDASVLRNTMTLSFAIAFRHRILDKSPEEREAYIAASPSAERRALLRDVIEHGVDSDRFAPAVRAVDALVGDLDDALAQRDWLAGDDYSLADIAYTPYVTRLDHLALGELWRERPRVADWFARVKSRASYTQAIDAWLAPPLVAALRRAGERALPAAQQALRS